MVFLPLPTKRRKKKKTSSFPAFLVAQGGDGQILAVYDLGGGTFDISILEISGGVPWAVGGGRGGEREKGERLKSLRKLKKRGWKKEGGKYMMLDFMIDLKSFKRKMTSEGLGIGTLGSAPYNNINKRTPSRCVCVNKTTKTIS